MLKSMDPLKVTAPDLHRFWFKIYTPDQWYSVIHECRNLYGRNWRTKRHVLKRFNKVKSLSQLLQSWMYVNVSREIWFEVPDPAFATWISLKYSIEVFSDYKYNNSGK
jgi:hypothetical protein